MDPHFTDFERDGAKLDRLYIPTRYPNGGLVACPPGPSTGWTPTRRSSERSASSTPCRPRSTVRARLAGSAAFRALVLFEVVEVEGSESLAELALA